MNEYVYNGPVMEFGKLIAERWYGSTYAVSETKAKSNLAYRFKQENGKCATSKISLPGKLKLIREGKGSA